MGSNARAGRRALKRSATGDKHVPSTIKNAASDTTPKTPRPRQSLSDVGQAGSVNPRADYRAVRAAKEGKKYINVLIDEELQLEVRPRMMLRKLTWETLIEGLLKKWLKANPKFRP